MAETAVMEEMRTEVIRKAVATTVGMADLAAVMTIVVVSDIVTIAEKEVSAVDAVRVDLDTARADLAVAVMTAVADSVAARALCAAIPTQCTLKTRMSWNAASSASLCRTRTMPKSTADR